ncbi:MAG: metal ABC transporter solute-binding protein, Zn/Mn family [Microbacterium sp.]|uniref:metal ABC transporter solute-binding protein, Zn/Mn family n=1 Tax=Microbacterium sp. TaxID=51671 RepID=UPI003A83C2A8
MKRAGAVIAGIAASTLLMAGCAGGGADAPDDGKITVVASTSVYGQIAEAIGGDAVEVGSIVTSASQDPHSFEASARDQLTVSRADLVIENGGGYDAFMVRLIDASGTTAPVLTAAESSHDWPENEGHDHIEGFNEHVWYDPYTMGHLAQAIADALTALDPSGADAFAANLQAFSDGIARLEAALADIAVQHDGVDVFVTEPVSVSLVEAAGMHNVTPPTFSQAVEEGQDVAPATLLQAMRLIETGEVGIVIANAQAGGAETTQVLRVAEAQGVAVLEFTETLPEGQTYLSWMQSNVEALADAVAE